jgi:hypothetical protein
LQSENFRQEINLVVLPDTVYEPRDIWDQMLTKLTQASACYAVCESANGIDASTWGVVRENPFQFCEKPQEHFASPYLYWGLMMFRRKIGKALLPSHLQSTFDHQWKSFSDEKISLARLSKFQDLTRK